MGDPSHAFGMRNHKELGIRKDGPIILSPKAL
jgi:hypothetical protein